MHSGNLMYSRMDIKTQVTEGQNGKKKNLLPGVLFIISIRNET